MGKRIGMEVAIAAAEAVALCNIDVAAVYPITPQSHIAEHMADVIHDGRIDSEFITVESEHSAISACAGASRPGARVYTATSSQGLMLMHEILPIVSAMRLPVVMANANRAVSGPLNIWNDHTDIMPQRDSGWISIFAENGQEVIDLTIMSFKIAEHPDVMLPVIVNMDGFQLDPHDRAPRVPEQGRGTEIPAAANTFRDPAPGQTGIHGMLRYARHLYGDHEGEGDGPHELQEGRS